MQTASSRNWTRFTMSIFYYGNYYIMNTHIYIYIYMCVCVCKFGFGLVYLFNDILTSYGLFNVEIWFICKC